MRRSNGIKEKHDESKGESKLISTVSGGVRFYPPSKKYWRIGGSFYDFSSFMKRHPGGSEVMLMARDRFEDATFVFEAHHHNYKKARAMIRKYRVPDAKMTNRRPRRDEIGEFDDVHFDDLLDQGKTPRLIDDDSFYSVLRLRVTRYLRDIGCPIQCARCSFRHSTIWSILYLYLDICNCIHRGWDYQGFSRS